MEHLGGFGERCIGLCQRLLKPSEKPTTNGGSYNVAEFNFPTTELCFLGIVAVMDPPRPSVRKALQQCHTSGIKVVMVTGMVTERRCGFFDYL